MASSVSTTDGEAASTSTTAATIDIVESANSPKSMAGDEGSITERSISEMIMADRYSKSGDIDGAPFGIMVGKMKPGGSV